MNKGKIIIGLSLLGLATIGYFADKDKRKIEANGQTNKIEDNDSAKPDTILETASNRNNQSKKFNTKTIQGIQPVDVYGNFEKRGFLVDKKITAEGSIFTNTFTENGIDYSVETYCEDGVTNVTSITLNAIRMYPQYNTVVDMKDFLKYGCTIPYDGADIPKVKDFIENNYFRDKATITISGVKFTIYSPTQFVRMLDIEKE